MNLLNNYKNINIKCINLIANLATMVLNKPMKSFLYYGYNILKYTFLEDILIINSAILKHFNLYESCYKENNYYNFCHF